MFGKTRQGWYKQQHHLENEVLREAIVLKHVQDLSHQMPRIGTRKLHYMLSSQLVGHNISLGRDQLFDILSNLGLLVKRRKRRKIATTNSNHPYKKYPNLIKGISVLTAGRVWVSDITYISLKDRYSYLSLITDMYSRQIVGYCLWPSLDRQGPLNALRMALKSNSFSNLIHHSDRGIQYCCNEYTSLLQQNKISISMTKNGDPYENSLAERVNGILKDELGLELIFENFQQAVQSISQAIKVYNNIRPHASINYLTPPHAHREIGKIAARWKSKKQQVYEIIETVN